MIRANIHLTIEEKQMNMMKRVVPLFVVLIYGHSTASAAPFLGSAQDFTVLGASTVTNTGTTILQGDIGAYPGASITGLGSVSLTGTVHLADASAQQAQLDVLNAYNILAGQSIFTDLSGQNLGGLTLTPGVYHFNTLAQLTGTLTLDFLGNPNSSFVFQIGSTLTTASNALVNVIDGNSNSGVYWQVGASATLGSSTVFAGNILADQSITLSSASKILCGRALALNAAVTLDTNVLSDNCNAFNDSINTLPVRSDYGSYGFSSSQSVSEPMTLALLASGLLGLGFVMGGLPLSGRNRGRYKNGIRMGACFSCQRGQASHVSPL